MPDDLDQLAAERERIERAIREPRYPKRHRIKTWREAAAILGVDEDTLNRLDAILQPMVDAGYARADDPATAPITVDPVNGYDPAEITAPATQAAFGEDVGTDPISQMLALIDSSFSSPGS